VKEVRKRKQRLAIILLVAGLLLALSPYVYHRYYLYVNQQEVEEPLQNQIQTEPETNAAEESDIPEKLVEDTGILEIPALGLKVNVGYGVEESDLQPGPGFYPQSQYPDIGNVSIAGHRNVHGSPFLNLHRLAAEDEIILTYRHKEYTYSVQEVFETHSRDWSVIDPTPEPALTLTTCTPIIKPPGGDYDRLIVRARLVATKSLD
jgi:sortase A